MSRKLKLSFISFVGILSLGCSVANANENKVTTEFVFVAPYLGSIRDVYPSITIQTYRTDYFSYSESVNGDGFGKAMEYLYSGQKEKSLKMCRELEGQYKKVLYGFDNISASERQVTDIAINRNGGTNYTTGQKVHYLFNMYCATL